ncbi:MAG: hypothetical protein KGL39_22180 [Patescibacteria group bacterium]|nr:hypothetical protein [Patescibacteria group bacterium]
MKKGGGREKGSRFEREVAKIVVRAFADKGITQKDCYRTPLSGGHRFAAQSDPGDLVISERLRRFFPYAVECKSYKKLDWPKLISNAKQKGHWDKWWRQATKAADAQSCGRGLDRLYPLLIFRQNRSEIYVMGEASLMQSFTVPVKIPYVVTRVDGLKVRVVLFSRFMEAITCSR